MVAAAIIGGAALSAGSSLIGGSAGAGAANKASANDMAMYNQTRTDLLPFQEAGKSVLPNLVSLATSGPTGGGPDYVTAAAGERPGTMTQAELEKTPGYQWNLTQGLKATQSAAAARGLGVSGASLKGAATFATGLADSTYQNQFNNQQQRFADLLSLNTGQQGNLTNQYNRLSGVATIGEDAAAKTGAAGTSLANASGNALMAGGQATGASIAGAGNAVSSGINNYLQYQAYQNAQNTSGYYNSGSSPAPIDMNYTRTG